MKVLVTGASGFIGQSVVQRLLEEGHQVLGMYRREIVPPELHAIYQLYAHTCTLVRFDLDFPQSMPVVSVVKKAMKDAQIGVPGKLPEWKVSEQDVFSLSRHFERVDVCIHIAARVGDWGTDEEFFASNVVSTKVLLEVARVTGLSRFVYLSSLAVHGFGHNRQNTEDGVYFKATNPYQCSKRCSEHLVQNYIADGNDAVIIRPGNVYGNGDTTTFYPIFDALRAGHMGTIASGRFLTCPVHKDDVVSAISSSLTTELAERPHVFNVVSGEKITWRELLDLCSDALGIPRSKLSISAFVARTVALVLECSFKLFRAKTAPPLTKYRVEQLLHDYDFSIARATQYLGYRPKVVFKEGFALCAAAYYRTRGREKF